jgi:hypothetical protein
MNKLMSKISILVLMVTALTASPAKADITDSSLFEPVIGCVAAGAGGYLIGNPNGNGIIYGAIGCGVGVLVGVLLNSHYSSKYGRVYQQDISDLRGNVKELQLQQAMRAAHGDDDDYALRIKTVVPGQRLPDGTITAPTLREKLVAPGENLRIGD